MKGTRESTVKGKRTDIREEPASCLRDPTLLVSSDYVSFWNYEQKSNIDIVILKLELKTKLDDPLDSKYKDQFTWRKEDLLSESQTARLFSFLSYLHFKELKLTKRRSVTNASRDMGFVGYQRFEYLDKLLLNTSN